MGREDLKPSSSIVFIFHFLLHGADVKKYILILASFSFFIFFCMELT